MARKGRLKLLFQTALTFYASVDFHAYDYAAKSAACVPTELSDGLCSPCVRLRRKSAANRTYSATDLSDGLCLCVGLQVFMRTITPQKARLIVPTALRRFSDGLH